MGSRTREEYTSAKYFPALDGLRAISVLLVVAVHVDNVRPADSLVWTWLSGQTGVRVFFVISGYLITMLALREEAARQRLSLAAFYVRRTFRIFPAYYATLLLYIALILWPGMASTTARAPYLLDALPYYLFYANEFAPPAPFFQSWSLGVEEKFYLLWPAVAFVVLHRLRRWRLPLALALGVGLQAFRYLDDPYRTWAYGDIFLGCAVAIVLDDERGFEALRVFGSRAWGVIALTFMLTTQLAYVLSNSVVGVIYPFAVSLLLVHLTLTDAPWKRWLENRALCHIGRLSYSMYLLHVLCIQVVHRLLGAPTGLVMGLVETVVAALASIAAAQVMFSFLEKPLIRRGRATSRRILESSVTESRAVNATAALAPAVADPSASDRPH